VRSAVAALLLALACTSPSPAGPTAAPAPVDVSAREWKGPPLDRGQVVVHDVYGGVHPVVVEIADTPDARTRGMMWRTAAPDGTGMLFLFPSEDEHGFWMRNTLIPLDILFLDRSGQVVGIVAQAEPQSLDHRRVGRPSLYVLEVVGGWSEKAGVVPGARVELKGGLASRRGQP
jgi:uncharacterized membrane protein (UPF0127 family)